MKTDILNLIPEKYLPDTGAEGVVRKVLSSAEYILYTTRYSNLTW